MLAFFGCGAAVLLLGSPARAQVDSGLVARILMAEDRRDSTDRALGTGAASTDVRVRLIAQRAIARIRDPKFATRDSFPSLPAPPAYADPAWRLRYRALGAKRDDCSALQAALSDENWAVRLRALDLLGPSCASDSTLVGIVRRWASSPPTNARRNRGQPGWQGAAHALLAMGRLAPNEARGLLSRYEQSPVPWLRLYAVRSAVALSDTVRVRRMVGDRDDNVREAAVDGLTRIAGHSADDVIIPVLSSRGYQAVRAAARALKGSPQSADVLAASLVAARRLRADSSETSRDARVAVLERIGEFATAANTKDVVDLARDFDCEVAHRAAAIAMQIAESPVQQTCTPLPRALPPDAVALALGKTVLLRVTLADSSGGGSFTVRLRGDVAPIMAARMLALAKSGYYNGLPWQRVEPDFVLQGGSPGANEYVGHPRFLRDELGTVPHVRGTVGMSTRGHDTGDAQWFVNLRDNLRLNADYTIFAEVVDGIDVVDGVLEGDVIASVRVVP